MNNLPYKIVTDPIDLPVVFPGDEIFLDFETTNHTGKGGSKNSMPHHGDKICGAAITINDDSTIYYIPVRHTDGPNIDVWHFQCWLRDSVVNAGRWVNHNIKFDAHFAAADGAKFKCDLVDTMTQAKIYHNYLPEYGLKELSAKYLGAENWKDEIEDWLATYKSPNYADVPVGMMAKYAAQDVHYNRLLYRWLNDKMPSDCLPIWKMEQQLTPVLYDLEVQGLLVDPDELQQEQDKSFIVQENLQQELEKIVGWRVNVNSSKQLEELLVNQLKLPVVAWTDPRKNKTGVSNPSFGKEAMGLYGTLPQVLSDHKIAMILKLVQELVKERHFCSLFLTSYLELQVDGVLHSEYVQCIRSGRKSCKTPNSQQLDERAKKLIKSLPGHNIWDWDYSQIEYRLITHYTNNVRAIKAYNDDPLMDFHNWVADLARIPRKPAKTLNFRLAYGSGKPAAVKSLICLLADEINKEVDDLIRDEVWLPDERTDLFQNIFQSRGGSIYDKYHAFQPELKKTLDRAGKVLEKRGYIITIGGRRSYIPPKLSYKALNYVVQGSAADIMKNRMIAASPRYNKVVRAFGVKPFAVVHDDTPQHTPKDVDEQDYIEYTKKILEDVPYEIKVPILVSGEKHTENWAA